MKKYGLLFVMVLALSTTAWGSMACVSVPPCVCACEPVTANVRACIPYDCELHCESVCVRGNVIVVDMLYVCEDCPCGGATCINENIDLGELCPGMYSVVVKIRCACSCDSCPKTCALGSTFFRTIYCPTCP